MKSDGVIHSPFQNREFIIAVLGLIIGILFASALLVDKVEQSNWTSDRFIEKCNKLYGNDSWFLAKADEKYVCMGNNTLVLPDIPGAWKK